MNYLFKISLILIGIFVFLFNQDLKAQYQLKRGVISNGAGHMESSDHGIKYTLGQTGTGVLSNNNYNIYSGFWYISYLSVSIPDNNVFQLPQKFELFQNYPNPFNPLTTIEYQLPKSSQVEICIYNMIGHKVATLVSGKQAAGTYKIEWNASSFSSGVYLYRLETDQGYSKTKKLILVK